jgi:ABC-2 type transport system ATP-binding protein
MWPFGLNELSMAQCAVATERLSKRYRAGWGVQDISLRIPLNSTYLLVGPNGAGKSTAIQLILNLLGPSSGSVSVLGCDPLRHPARVRSHIGYVPEKLDWGYGWMTVERLLAHHAAYYPAWNWSYSKALCSLFELPLAQRMRSLSKGQGRRVHLVMALAHCPPLLILDEPTDGLDPVMRVEALEAMEHHLRTFPTTVLLCTHHVSEVEHLATTCGVLSQGRLRAQDRVPAIVGCVRRYVGTAPATWSPEDVGHGLVHPYKASPERVDVIVAGDERTVVERLQQQHVQIARVEPLTLSETLMAILRHENPAPIVAANRQKAPPFKATPAVAFKATSVEG